VLLEAFAASVTAHTLRCLGNYGDAAEGVESPDSLPMGGFGTAAPSFLSAGSAAVDVTHGSLTAWAAQTQRPDGRSSGRAPALLGGACVGRVVACGAALRGRAALPAGTPVIAWSSPCAPVAAASALVAARWHSVVPMAPGPDPGVVILASLRPAVRAVASLGRVPGGVAGRAVMVVGAGDGPGLAAVQAAVSMGASLVVAVAATDAGLAALSSRTSVAGARRWAGRIAAVRGLASSSTAAALHPASIAEKAEAAAEGGGPPASAEEAAVVVVDGRLGGGAVLDACMRATGGLGADAVVECTAACACVVAFSDMVRCAAGGATIVTCPDERDDAELDASLARVARLKGLGVVLGAPEDAAAAVPAAFEGLVACVARAVDLVAAGAVRTAASAEEVPVGALEDAPAIAQDLGEAGSDDAEAIFVLRPEAMRPGTLLGPGR